MGKRLKFIDLTYLNSMSGGSEEIVIEMLGIFLEQLPEFREKFSKALKINDMKMLSDVAHKAKSSMAILGIEDVRARLAHLEKSIKEGVNHVGYQFGY